MIAQLDNRIGWPETWMTFAHMISRRSHDPKTKVGAVIVSADNAVVLALGYNGNYIGGPHSRDTMEDGGSNFIHAEENCIIKCPFHYPAKKIMYTTVAPCLMCAKTSLNAGVGQFVYDQDFRDMSGINLLMQAQETHGIVVHKLSNLIGASRYERFLSDVKQLLS